MTYVDSDWTQDSQFAEDWVLNVDKTLSGQQILDNRPKPDPHTSGSAGLSALIRKGVRRVILHYNSGSTKLILSPVIPLRFYYI